MTSGTERIIFANGDWTRSAIAVDKKNKEKATIEYQDTAIRRLYLKNLKSTKSEL